MCRRTDRQTDRRTDGQTASWHIQRWNSFQLFRRAVKIEQLDTFGDKAFGAFFRYNHWYSVCLSWWITGNTNTQIVRCFWTITRRELKCDVSMGSFVGIINENVMLTIFVYSYRPTKQGCPQDVKSQDRDETETFQTRSFAKGKDDSASIVHSTYTVSVEERWVPVRYSQGPL